MFLKTGSGGMQLRSLCLLGKFFTDFCLPSRMIWFFTPSGRGRACFQPQLSLEQHGCASVCSMDPMTSLVMLLSIFPASPTVCQLDSVLPATMPEPLPPLPGGIYRTGSCSPPLPIIYPQPLAKPWPELLGKVETCATLCGFHCTPNRKLSPCFDLKRLCFPVLDYRHDHSLTFQFLTGTKFLSVLVLGDLRFLFPLL